MKGRRPVLMARLKGKEWYLKDVGFDGPSSGALQLWNGKCYWTKSIKETVFDRLVQRSPRKNLTMAEALDEVWRWLHLARNQLIDEGRFASSELFVIWVG